MGIGSESDTTQRCSDPTRLWLVGSEHLLVVSDPDPIPYNGVKYNILGLQLTDINHDARISALEENGDSKYVNTSSGSRSSQC